MASRVFFTLCPHTVWAGTAKSYLKLLSGNAKNKKKNNNKHSQSHTYKQNVQ